MTREEIMEVRARINEYHPGELRDWLLKSLTALEEAWADLEMAQQIGDTFWEAVKPLKLQAINVANPGSHVSDLILERDSAIMEGMALAQEKDGLQVEIERLREQIALLQTPNPKDHEIAALTAKVQELEWKSVLRPCD